MNLHEQRFAKEIYTGIIDDTIRELYKVLSWPQKFNYRDRLCKMASSTLLAQDLFEKAKGLNTLEKSLLPLKFKRGPLLSS